MSTRTATPIDIYVYELARKMQQHNDPQQLADILRYLHELVSDANGKITEDHIDLIKDALTVGLGQGWTHLAEWEPPINDEGEAMPSPIESLEEVMSELGVTHTRLVFGKHNKNVGNFLKLGKPMEIVHRYTDEADDEVVDQPVEQLTVQAIEEARAHLASDVYTATGINFDLTIYRVTWAIEHRFPGHAPGDPVDMLYVFGGGRDSIDTTLSIMPETRISEENGRLILENCKMFLQVWGMFDFSEVSDELRAAAWGELFTDVHVTRLVINQETSTVESFDIQGYNN